VFEVGADRAFYQIGLRLLHRAADVKLKRILTGLGSCHKILANPAKQLTPNLIVDRENRIERELAAAQRNRTGGGKTQIRRTQNQLVDQNGAAVQVIFCFGLFEIELSQLLDLQQLPNGRQNRELLHAPVLQ